jgi:hypothetical protein
LSDFLFDTNVLLDLATRDPNWVAWSEQQFRSASTQGLILINPVIYAECAPAFADEKQLDSWFDARIFLRLPLPYAAAGFAQ